MDFEDLQPSSWAGRRSEAAQRASLGGASGELHSKVWKPPLLQDGSKARLWASAVEIRLGFDVYDDLEVKALGGGPVGGEREGQRLAGAFDGAGRLANRLSEG